MKIVEQDVKLISKQSYEDLLYLVEYGARNCYKSHDKMVDGGAENFVRGIMKLEHLSVLEHASIMLEITTSRAISHQWVRHRLQAISQESMRFCNYSKDKFDNNVRFIKPLRLFGHQLNYWEESCKRAEQDYFNLLNMGVPAELARGVLPHDVATTLVVTPNMRELRHILNLRLDKHAQYEIRDIAKKVYEVVKENYTVFVEGIEPND